VTMSRILFTGATGVLGRAGVPLLVGAGHDVTGVSRSETNAAWLERAGARPLSIDLFDPGSMANATVDIDTVVHFATAIPRQSAMPKRESWNTNDRLRDTSTGLLVDAAIAAGVRRFIQQSVTFAYADGEEEWLDEDSPLSPPWDVLDSALAAESHVTRFRQTGGVGVVLRLSRLYGPGPASSEYIESVANRKVPVVGRGRNYVSSIHVDDASAALLLALSAPGGTYNITDDEPVTSAEYVGVLAELLGAPRPRRIPGWLGKIVLGKVSGLLTTSQRVSNDRFAGATGWAPQFPSVREGWRHIIAPVK
jgi:nucleoside-diphosphate-sugar epimerase